MVPSSFADAVGYIQSQFAAPIDVVLVLGSGLGDLVSVLPDRVSLPYQSIPGFPVGTVEGHQGTLHLGTLSTGLRVALMQGRIHYYEGFDMAQVVTPLRILHACGAQTLMVTNSAGGINADFDPGDLMLITDHINLMGAHPLRGANDESLGPRFPDMSKAYTPALQQLAREKAVELGIYLKQGVYLATSGPSYETPAEIRMMRTLGADAVGMSTAPEVIAARHMGMSVLGISCITNPAAGVRPDHILSHHEVLETSNRVKVQFSQLLESILRTLPVS